MIEDLIKSGAYFICNHSGGKDSQAMYIHLKSIIPVNQLVVIHAHLPEVEWPGVIEHIESTITSPLFIAKAKKTFFQMVEHRQMWPSPKNRQCTSDLKRGPIEKVIRNFIKDKPVKIIVNCMGLRAEESSARAKKTTFKINEGNSKAGRIWYDWLPIHQLTTRQVFSGIENSGQKPHWAYAAGMSRLSCCFCIMASKSDLKKASELMPELAKRYSDTEIKIGQSFLMPAKNQKVFLPEIFNQ